MNKKIIIPLIILVGLVSYLLYLTKFKDSNDQPFSDFTIEDTTSITKLQISRTNGEKIALIKNENNWMIEGTNEAANEAALQLITKTLSQWKVLQDVESKNVNQVIKLLATKHTKIEIFESNSKTPFKTIYLGDHNASMTGNYALLQKGNKKSSIPYLINLPGFYGTLETRFFANFNSWRSTKVMTLGTADIQSITLKNYSEPNESYTISIKNDAFSLADIDNSTVSAFDTLSVRRHLVAFKELYFESFVTHLKDKELKDLLATTPLYELQVLDNNNFTTNVKVYCKKPELEKLDSEGNPIPCDTERLYAYVNNEKLVIIQSFGWGNVFKPLSYFAQQ